MGRIPTLTIGDQCPEWCDHAGRCADWRTELSRAEHAAEMAVERYLEDGGSAALTIAAEDDHERELEAMDLGLQELRGGLR